jgi:Chaperone of endosialidase
MRNLLMAIMTMVAAAALMAIGLPINVSNAMPPGNLSGMRTAIDDLSTIDKVQYYWWEGRRYCWYNNGWHGPGWYVCRYGPWVTGSWWGGGYGWHHWRYDYRVRYGWHWRAGHRVRDSWHHRGGRRHAHGGGRHHHGGGGHHHGGGGHHHGGGGHHGGRHHSDIRLKEDIVRLTRLDNGIGLYRFRYKGNDHAAYVGVMAQEVQEREPTAVWRDRNGYLVVNYNRLGLKFMTWDEWLARARSMSE